MALITRFLALQKRDPAKSFIVRLRLLRRSAWQVLCFSPVLRQRSLKRHILRWRRNAYSAEVLKSAYENKQFWTDAHRYLLEQNKQQAQQTTIRSKHSYDHRHDKLRSKISNGVARLAQLAGLAGQTETVNQLSQAPSSY